MQHFHTNIASSVVFLSVRWENGWHVKKRMNRSRLRGTVWEAGSCWFKKKVHLHSRPTHEKRWFYWVFVWNQILMNAKVDAIRCAVAMLPFTNLLWTLVLFIVHQQFCSAKAIVINAVLAEFICSIHARRKVYLRSERTSYARDISLNFSSASSLFSGFLSGCQRSASLRYLTPEQINWLQHV